MTRSRILVVDDHELFRESMVTMLDLQPDLEVVGQARDGLDALRLVRDTGPDLVLMDVSMPLCDGIDGTRLIIQEFPGTRILMLSVNEDDRSLFDALAAGARGYILKNTDKTTFLRSIRQVLSDEAALSPKQAKKVVDAYSRMARSAPLQERAEPRDDLDITAREREVLALVADGATNQEIAQQLSVSIYTVKSHVRSILHKLDATSRNEAAQRAAKLGIIPPRRRR